MAIDQLQEKIRKMKNPVMVGLDPTQDLLPPQLLEDSFANYGQTPQGLSNAYLHFCQEILETLKEAVPAVKIQSACFLSLGAYGISAMQELCRTAKELGYYVLIDTMRADVPHIAALYAEAMFGGVQIGARHYEPFSCDALTLNGYLGSDAIKPFLPYCKEKGKNIFLLVKTSNRSGREVQDLLSGDRQVHTAVADLLMRWSDGLFGKSGYSELGAVMGATDVWALQQMRRKYDRLFFLVTGYGLQGGGAKHAAEAFDALGHGAIVTASRNILGAWKKAESDGTDYQERALQAALKMKKDILKYVTVM